MKQQQFVFTPPGEESIEQNGGGIYEILRTTDLARMLQGNNLSQTQVNITQTQGETMWVESND